MSPRLLFVDDNADVRAIARVGLERLGDWSVVDAGSGEEALVALTDEGPFDAILLDEAMPGLDGPATLARLRATPSGAETPVVLLTAPTQRADRAQFGTPEAPPTIAKPLDPLALSGQVTRALGR